MDENLFFTAAKKYNDMKPIRMHMPGHAGHTFGSPYDALLPFDMTELGSYDDLYAPSPDGLVNSVGEWMRDVYGSRATCILPGGATLAIQTAIALVLKCGRGRKIFCDRRAHLSAVNAMTLCGAEPEWFFPQNLPDSFEGAAAVFLTSTDYYGVTADVSAVAKRCEAAHIPLIADNSHGSHLAFCEGGCRHPLRLGAELVIDSLHKTLPALTGAALLHCAGEWDGDAIRSAARLFASTSPSYLIAGSAACAVSYMTGEGGARLLTLIQRLDGLRARLRDRGYGLPGDDPLRLCLECANAKELDGRLAETGIISEFSTRDRVILLPSVLITDPELDRLESALMSFSPRTAAKTEPWRHIPTRAVTLREAAFSPCETIPLTDAEGRVAATYSAPYPPGIPVIMPGEITDSEVIRTLGAAGTDRIAVMTAK